MSPSPSPFSTDRTPIDGIIREGVHKQRPICESLAYVLLLLPCKYSLNLLQLCFIFSHLRRTLFGRAAGTAYFQAVMMYTRRLSFFHACLSLILFLSALPAVRADYASAYSGLYRAFFHFTIKVPDRAGPDPTVLATHEDSLWNNLTKYNNATTNWQDNKISDAEYQTQSDKALVGFQFSYYQLIGDYMGVGVNSSCKSYVSNVLESASEWDRAGQQAASVIMALLPSLLTFGTPGNCRHRPSGGLTKHQATCMYPGVLKHSGQASWWDSCRRYLVLAFLSKV